MGCRGGRGGQLVLTFNVINLQYGQKNLAGKENHQICLHAESGHQKIDDRKSYCQTNCTIQKDGKSSSKAMHDPGQGTIYI